MASNKVIIIGAGIGGLTLAQALRKRGITFEIYERDNQPSARRQGFAIALSWILTYLQANMSDDMPSLSDTSVWGGAPADLASATVGIPKAAYWDGVSGKRTFAIPADPTHQGFIRVNRLMFREWLSTNIKIHWEKGFAKSQVLEDGRVKAMFEDGEVVQGRLLVGATS